MENSQKKQQSDVLKEIENVQDNEIVDKKSSNTTSHTAKKKEKEREGFIHPKADYVLRFLFVGLSGIGKTTLIKHLIEEIKKQHLKWTEEESESEHSGDPSEEKKEQEPEIPDPTLKIEVYSCDVKKDNVNYTVELLDSPGQGTFEDQLKSLKIVIDELEKRFKSQKGKKFQLPNKTDLVDIIFYCFTPHRILPLEIESIKEYSKYATLFPLIVKADSCTKEELDKQKKEIGKLLGEDVRNRIKVIVANKRDIGWISNTKGEIDPWKFDECEGLDNRSLVNEILDFNDHRQGTIAKYEDWCKVSLWQKFMNTNWKNYLYQQIFSSSGIWIAVLLSILFWYFIYSLY